MIPEIDKEEAERSEHLEDCPGRDNCWCFGRYVSYRNLYDTQEEVARLRSLLERTQRFVKLAALVVSGVNQHYRHFPLPPDVQAVHDSTDRASEILLGDIDDELRGRLG